MADVSSLLPEGWDVIQPTKDPGPPEQQLQEAMSDSGITPPDILHFDGKIHRFSIGGKRDKTGWYVVYSDGIPAGAFGDWRTSETTTWVAQLARHITPIERAAIRASQVRAQEERKRSDEAKHETVASVASDIWAAAGEAPKEHPYLVHKGIQPFGTRITGDGRLITPVCSPNGDIKTLQYISDYGNKSFHAGGAVKGGFHVLGEQVPGRPIYLAEGFATAASIHEATGCPTVVAYNAGNLIPVAQTIREQTGPSQDIVIVADNDESGVGLAKANEAAEQSQARVIMPPVTGDANDYAQGGGDLKALLLPPDKPDWLIPAKEFVKKPAPIRWLIKRWLQAEAYMMLFGPSGAGKTFVALDMACRIASNDIDEWQGNKVRHGTVVYLAGEGHHGLKARLAGWMDYNDVEDLNLWISRDGCDLNTSEGLNRTMQNIRATGEKVTLIVVDTLHRFLRGDENSAQDSKTMLDACAALVKEFCCSILLVHHTGVNQEAQGRARGSSSWKGAQDIEIQVSQCAQGTILVHQSKAKDSEPAEDLWLQQEEIDVPGWQDEDGEQVTTVILRSGEKPKGGKSTATLTENQRNCLASYRLACEQHGLVGPGSEFIGLELEAWRPVAYATSTASAASKRQNFDTARKDLVRKGHLKVDGTLYRPDGEFSELEETALMKAINERRSASQ